MGLIALSVADDAFIHREPGSATSEHLLSGLAPIAIGAALAFGYPRLRPGLRAIAVLVCGTLQTGSPRPRLSPFSATPRHPPT